MNFSKVKKNRVLRNVTSFRVQFLLRSDFVSSSVLVRKNLVSSERKKTDGTQRLNGEHQEIKYKSLKENKTHQEIVEIDVIAKLSLNLAAV